jgi:hypothetical protein
MQRLFTSSLIFATVLLSTGTNGGIVQFFGWTRLFATYSKAMPAFEAIRLTFSNGVICGDEEIVETVRKELGDSPAVCAGADSKPVLLIPTASAPMISKPACDRWFPVKDIVSDSEKSSPPVPPPRGGDFFLV